MNLYYVYNDLQKGFYFSIVFSWEQADEEIL